jgi:hypothetical protein
MRRENIMPRKQQSIPVLVIAILHLVLGGLGLLCFGGSGALMLAGFGNGQNPFANFGPPQMQKQQQEQQQAIKRMTESIPQYQLYQVTVLGTSLLLSAALVAAGLGLLSMQPWARIVSIAYGVLSILHTLCVTVFTFLYIIPAQQQAFEQIGAMNAAMNPQQAAMQANLMKTMGQAMGPMTLFFQACYLVYPITVLIIMLLPSVRAAFQGKAMSAPTEDYDDRYDDASGPTPQDDRFRPREH